MENREFERLYLGHFIEDERLSEVTKAWEAYYRETEEHDSRLTFPGDRVRSVQFAKAAHRRLLEGFQRKVSNELFQTAKDAAWEKVYGRR